MSRRFLIVGIYSEAKVPPKNIYIFKNKLTLELKICTRLLNACLENYVKSRTLHLPLGYMASRDGRSTSQTSKDLKVAFSLWSPQCL